MEYSITGFSTDNQVDERGLENSTGTHLYADQYSISTESEFSNESNFVDIQSAQLGSENKTLRNVIIPNENVNIMSEINFQETCNVEIPGSSRANEISEGESTDSESFQARVDRSTSSSSSNSSSSESDPYGSDDSIADPPYIIISPEHPVAEIPLEIPTDVKVEKRKVQYPSSNEKVGRKKLKRSSTWQKANEKLLRNSGETYESMGFVKNADGTKTKLKIKRPAKSVQPPCGNKCKLKCSEKLNELQRTKIFREYWDLKDLEKQREFISSNLKPVTPRYKYSNKEEPRKPNNAYYFIVDGKQLRVCKYFFMATLAINHKVITTVLKKQIQCESATVLEKDKRGRHRKHKKVNEDIKNSVRNHIGSIPRIESHYCRSHSSKEYIQGSKTIADLHRDYLDLCREKKQQPGNYLMYFKIFNEEFNIGFHLPKKDMCELCLQYRSSTEEQRITLEEKFDKHVKEKDLSRQEKELDKKSDDKTKVIVYDLQSVLPCPIGEASSFYYVSKLNVFNFTLFDIKCHEGTCFLWHEGEAQRGSNEIGPCILRYLEIISENKEDLNIVFYSDNCAGQNKNKFIIALYLYALHNLPISSITHKFFVTGHGQSEGDSVHSMIEKQIKKYKKIKSNIFTGSIWMHYSSSEKDWDSV